MYDLQGGDVLSYSAGSTQTGPDGYRKLRPRTSLLEITGRRWPDLVEALGERPVLFINAYPAMGGPLANGIFVDTYLSPRVLSRALQLGKAAGHPVILLGQPLFLADALLRHVAAERALPETLMIWAGGYVMHRSLEQTLVELLSPHLRRLIVLQYFGAAEVDAGCLMARERNAQGELVYYPREDVEPAVDGEDLLLTLRSATGETVVDRFRTGDLARPCGDGWVVWNPQRLHPKVNEALESWSREDWTRRTGYVQREGEEILVQLRQGESPREETEIEHFEFARRFGFSWLDKPYWR